MRWLVWIFVLLLPVGVLAQSRTVLPTELKLEVIVEETEYQPHVGEMVLLTIRGKYRRHITRESLEQPDLDGFNWTQLGPDSWRTETVRGRPVKVLERQMALFPKRAGTLTIGPFVHHLTLTDEKDDWFGHDIQSDPITITVAAVPPQADGTWWFPTRSLRVSDQWSNPPDQLQPGEGVLRIVHIQAVGVTPEMIPPMPELSSPSAMIFPHPEKRLVELSPEGPVTHAFWRWTLRPTNTVSAVLEPIEVPYFDTKLRQHQTVLVSAQRVAYGDYVPQQPQQTKDVFPAVLPGGFAAIFGGGVFAIAAGLILRGRRLAGWQALRRFPMLDPLAIRMRKAARSGDVARVRRTATEMLRRDVATSTRLQLIDELDRRVFAGVPTSPSGLSKLVQRFLQNRARDR